MNIGIVLMGWGMIALLVVMILMVLATSGVISIHISFGEDDEEEQKPKDEESSDKE